MKVRLKTSIAGDGFSHQYGAEIELSAEEAARFIERGLAEPVEAPAAKQEQPAPKPRKSKKA